MAGTATITGGAGFIGSHLVRALLAQGWQVRVVDDFSTGDRSRLPEEVSVYEGDVGDPALVESACDGAQLVFHLAARVSIRQSSATYYEDADTNLMGTLNTVRAASKAGVKRLVFASSMAVYSDAPTHTPIREDHPTNPISPYGVAKLAAERDLLLLGPKLGLEPVVLRFFNVFGPGQGFTPYVGVLTIFVTQILANQPCVIFGDGAQCRDFTHVDDIVRGCIAAAIEPTAAGEIFNVGSGVGTTVSELAEIVRAHMGRGEFQRGERDDTELQYSVADVAKAAAILGYRPAETLAARLPEVIAAIEESTAP